MSLPRGKYFTAAELACRDGTPYPETWALRLAVLFDALDTIREAYGAKLRVVSGYRTTSHNLVIGGAKASQHMVGRAVDLCPVKREPGDIERLHAIVNDLIERGKLPAVGGVGFYAGRWLHIDTRAKVPTGHIARWTGAKFGDEQQTA